MPTISYFYDISTGEIKEGKLPPKARALTEEWRLIHKKELIEAWDLMLKYEKVKKIPGLK